MRWLRRSALRTVAPAADAAVRPTELITPRLRLRPLAVADLDALHALWTAPGVRRHLWGDRILREEQTRDLLMQSEYLLGERGYGYWGAFDTDGCMIGFAGFGFFRSEHELELLYGVAEAHWYQGYAREMAQALIGYGFEHLQLEEIRASTEAANAASVRLLRRLGFVPDRARGLGGPTLFFRLPRGVHQGAEFE